MMAVADITIYETGAPTDLFERSFIAVISPPNDLRFRELPSKSAENITIPLLAVMQIALSSGRFSMKIWKISFSVKPFISC